MKMTTENACVEIKAPSKVSLLVVALLASALTGGAISVPQWLVPNPAVAASMSLDESNRTEHAEIKKRLDRIEEILYRLSAVDAKLDLLMQQTLTTKRK